MTNNHESQIKGPKILVINGGSSSIKFTLYEIDKPLRQICKGAIDRIGLSKSTMNVKGIKLEYNFSSIVAASDHKEAVCALIDWLEKIIGSDGLAAVGHRIVHGGPKYYEPQLITWEMIDDLSKFMAFDPEHLPEEILLSQSFQKRFPKVPQVACFDTAFHHDLPQIAKLLPIPRRYEAQGVRRYGFHGLSYAFLMEELVRIAGKRGSKGRIILAHLGSGASLAAVKDGKSIDTSMSFTPTSGLVMGTRSGDLDPGINYYLACKEGITPMQFQKMVNHESGLLGISQISSDVQDLLLHKSKDIRAQEAIEIFCYQAKKWIGSFTAALGGLDTLVFAGGIGENSPEIRARICDQMKFFGIFLDKARNNANSAVISTRTSKVTVRVIHTDEDLMIARSVCHILMFDISIKHKGI